MKKLVLFGYILMSYLNCLAAEDILKKGLVLDLNANKGVVADDQGKVSQWGNQVKSGKAKVFVINDTGKRSHKKGSGRPTLKKKLAELNGSNSLVFENDELINGDEDTFDSLTTGSGHTWFVVLKPYKTNKQKTEFGQKPLNNVNAFIGNLKNGNKYCGFWGVLDDDLTLWTGCRNDLTFGRFDRNNPKLTGPKLEQDKFYVIASRLAKGTGSVKCDLFVNEGKSVATTTFPVNDKADASKLAIGTERDAIEHPGVESFDGEIARVLIYERPLSDDELSDSMELLKKTYFKKK